MENYKLIFINNDKFVVVDESAEINNQDAFLIDDYGVCKDSLNIIMNSDKRNLGKVTASSYHISDSIPLISNTVDEIRQMYKDKEIEELALKLLPIIDNGVIIDCNRGKRHWFIEGYKVNTCEYTKEQIKDALDKAFMNGYSHAKNFDKQINASTYEILQLLKPKLEPIYCEIQAIENIKGSSSITEIKIIKLL